MRPFSNNNTDESYLQLYYYALPSRLFVPCALIRSNNFMISMNSLDLSSQLVHRQLKLSVYLRLLVQWIPVAVPHQKVRLEKHVPYV